MARYWLSAPRGAGAAAEAGEVGEGAERRREGALAGVVELADSVTSFTPTMPIRASEQPRQGRVEGAGVDLGVGIEQQHRLGLAGAQDEVVGGREADVRLASQPHLGELARDHVRGRVRVKLMTRLYDPTSGQVLLDGVDLREYDLEDLYKEIGVIFQDFMRYEMTARENIAVGKIEDLPSTELIVSAAHKSLADDVIAKLGNGYDQMLGRRFLDGVDLSGGEWQKLALARAYLRDAQLLILDEPTAALDARSEFEVFERFAELTHGKMSLFISHRFSTVKMADRIIVLANGKIAEDGDHRQLLALGGRYAGMFELQAASYR